ARDADILIYNGTIDESIGSIEELIGKDKMLADFKAVKEGRVYTTDDNLFQRTMSIPDLILDFDRIFNDTDVSDKDLIFLKQVR
ncbi:MAG: ABC transporter substrate-binding protein, partial [Lachnospiraceae bacterium]|nr:ABC transporter substrate-binding protein [Lachnospiraceae bacterium]